MAPVAHGRNSPPPVAGAEAGGVGPVEGAPPDSAPNSEVWAGGDCEIGAFSWESGLVPWLGSWAAVGWSRRGLRVTGRGVGAGVGVAMTSLALEEAMSLAGPRADGGLGLGFAIGRGAGARSGWPRIQPGVLTTPVATQSAPAPAPETQKPMIVAIVVRRPPPVCVAM